jgi:hypothetical protein
MTIENNPLPGRLVGRPDIDRPTLVAAIAARIEFTGGNPGVAPAILEMAEKGNQRALRIIRQLVLPPPVSPLAMPIQKIMREQKAPDTGLQRRFASIRTMFLG